VALEGGKQESRKDRKAAAGGQAKAVTREALATSLPNAEIADLADLLSFLISCFPS